MTDVILDPMTDVIHEPPSSSEQPMLGMVPSSLVSAEWQATAEGRDEMEITRILILARAPRSTSERSPNVPS